MSRAEISKNQHFNKLNKENEKWHESTQKREEIRQEYNSKVQSGEIARPSDVESKISIANGHEDNPATHAARRLLEKKGIKWREDEGLPESTPKPVNQEQQEASKPEVPGYIKDNMERLVGHKSENTKGLDHGELNIKGRTKNIDRDVDKYKKQQDAEFKEKMKGAVSDGKTRDLKIKSMLADNDYIDGLVLKMQKKNPDATKQKVKELIKDLSNNKAHAEKFISDYEKHNSSSI